MSILVWFRSRDKLDKLFGHIALQLYRDANLSLSASLSTTSMFQIEITQQRVDVLPGKHISMLPENQSLSFSHLATSMCHNLNVHKLHS